MSKETVMELNFDSLELIKVPVTIAGKRYMLWEADGEAACEYRNALLSSTVLNEEGKPIRVEKLADVEMVLVSQCLHYEDTEDKVPLETVKRWPNRVIKPIHDLAKKISKLNETGGGDDPSSK